jgi:hypothetical protein
VAELERYQRIVTLVQERKLFDEIKACNHLMGFLDKDGRIENIGGY